MSLYAVVNPATGETVMEYSTITDDELRAATKVLFVRSEIGNRQEGNEFIDDLPFVRAPKIADRRLSKGRGYR